MAISVTWPTGVIFVPQADTVLVGTDPISGREIREFDTDQFHENLRSEEETVAGRGWPITHLYNADVALGGVVYAPQFIMVNNYQVEFEQVAQPWRVIFTGTNNNIADFSVVNNVSIQPGNSVGLQIVPVGSGLSAAEQLELQQIHEAHFKPRAWDKVGNKIFIYEDNTKAVVLHEFDVNADLSDIQTVP